MGPPMCRFTNSLALTKQFKHVEAAVREAGKVGQKKKKEKETCHTKCSFRMTSVSQMVCCLAKSVV